jgi:hypothetical protein
LSWRYYSRIKTLLIRRNALFKKYAKDSNILNYFKGSRTRNLVLKNYKTPEVSSYRLNNKLTLPELKLSYKRINDTMVPNLVNLILKPYVKSRVRFRPDYNLYSSSYMLSYVKKFFEFFLNSKVTLFINFEILHRLGSDDKVFLNRMKSLLKSFSYKFSTIFFLNEFLDVLYLSFKIKNLNAIVPYFNRILKNLVVWHHKNFFNFFFEVIREHVFTVFDKLNILGLKIIIKGKIGVGGDSRKRWISLALGKTTNTRFNTNVHSINTWLNTVTGALGFRLILFYAN